MACSRPDGPTSTNIPLAPNLAPVVHELGAYTLSLTSTLSMPSNTTNNNAVLVDTATSVLVPQYLTINQNGSEAGRATLVLGTKQVYYRYDNTTYVFQDCTGCTVGQLVTVNTGESISLTIDQGYVTQTTSVTATLTVYR